jgi:hypothetical protein
MQLDNEHLNFWIIIVYAEFEFSRFLRVFYYTSAGRHCNLSLSQHVTFLLCGDWK